MTMSLLVSRGSASSQCAARGKEGLPPVRDALPDHERVMSQPRANRAAWLILPTVLQGLLDANAWRDGLPDRNNSHCVSMSIIGLRKSANPLKIVAFHSSLGSASAAAFTLIYFYFSTLFPNRRKSFGQTCSPCVLQA
jgi:hypothetical protein